MLCCVHAFTGTNTANLSKPTAFMNCSIASTLPRTWQDINRLLDPTAASNWRLSIKRYSSESRPSHPPPSKPAVVFSLNKGEYNDLSCLQNSLPTWLSPSLALRQCCQLAVVHNMWKKMTGSFNYLSCSVISDNKYKIRRYMNQQ